MSEVTAHSPLIFRHWQQPGQSEQYTFTLTQQNYEKHVRRCKQKWAISCIAIMDTLRIAAKQHGRLQKLTKWGWLKLQQTGKCVCRTRSVRQDKTSAEARTNQHNRSKVGILTELLWSKTDISMSQMLSALSIPPALCHVQFHYQQTEVGTAVT